jgi:hypothetical protein
VHSAVVYVPWVTSVQGRAQMALVRSARMAGTAHPRARRAIDALDGVQLDGTETAKATKRNGRAPVYLGVARPEL